jgi:membrane fusion protein (multidrug efflux system)
MPDDQKPNQSQPPQQAGRSRKKGYIIVFAILLMAGIIVAGYWYIFLRGVVSTDDAYIDANPTTVSSKMLGRLVFLSVDEGDTVDSGQLLAQLDDSDLQAQRLRAEAGLENARAAVPLAKINSERAEDDFNRAEIQYKKGAIPQEQYDHATKALEAAKAQYTIAQTQVKASRAQLAVVETELQNTRLVSPLSGVVAKKWVMPGNVVQPGQPIYTIYNLQDVWVTANFEETKLTSIHPGDKVEITVDAYSGLDFRGQVTLIGAAAASQFALIPPNNASGNFTKVTQRVPVKMILDSLPTMPNGAKPTLRPGMSVEVKLRVQAE